MNKYNLLMYSVVLVPSIVSGMNEQYFRSFLIMGLMIFLWNNTLTHKGDKAAKADKAK